MRDEAEKAGRDAKRIEARRIRRAEPRRVERAGHGVDRDLVQDLAHDDDVRARPRRAAAE